MMNRSKLDAYRELLRHTAGRIQRDAHAVENQTRMPTGGQADGGLSNVPMHLADIGTDVAHHEINSTLLENEQYLLDEALAALRRIDEGTFGRCENCGQPIAEARLDAIPYTRFCVECAASSDSKAPANMNAGRPKQETDTIAAREKLSTKRDQASELPAQLDAEQATADAIHAAGTPGGGTALGGLAGTNVGRGNPDGVDLEDASGSGANNPADDEDDAGPPEAGHAGGAVGDTPAGKRAGRTPHSPRAPRRSASQRRNDHS